MGRALGWEPVFELCEVPDHDGEPILLAEGADPQGKAEGSAQGGPEQRRPVGERKGVG